MFSCMSCVSPRCTLKKKRKKNTPTKRVILNETIARDLFPFPSLSHLRRGHSHLEGKIGMEAAPVPNPGNSRSELSSNSLPVDVALNVVSYLETADVCSLGSCSRFWRGLCSSDFVWIALYKRRWPALGAGSQPRASEGGGGGGGGGGGECSGDAEALSSPQKWRVLYINKHRQIASAVSTVIKFVQQCSQNESLEVGYYLKAVADLGLLELGFEDVQLFLFARKQNVLLNLIGLHYSIFSLAAPKSLQLCGSLERDRLVEYS
ncbi:uncharacterized protein LOC113463024 isoform X3 [Phoenix dactylifera]|uniref:Uncharacterized protein LOC113463024 isoform X3 n=1 Tax=Phoenix dactylifera TaxID=42345 RepID=A0A8B9APL4_PHODC|nr:uncharacterized protein LOC113463024 isoform X3 [Phoenix dactylifera]